MFDNSGYFTEKTHSMKHWGMGRALEGRVLFSGG